jgi:hypothetical protein
MVGSRKKGGKFIQYYNSTPEQQGLKTGLINNFYDEMPYLSSYTNKYSNDFNRLYSEAHDALAKSPTDFVNYGHEIGNNLNQAASQDFQRSLEPILQNMRDDYASRLGTFNQTPYIDRQYQLQRQDIDPTLENLALKSQVAGADLVPQYQGALAHNYNTLLNGFTEGANSDIQRRLSGLGFDVNGLSALQNQYLSSLGANSQFSQQAQQFGQNQFANNMQRYNNQMGMIGSLLGPTGSSFFGSPSGNQIGGSGGGDMSGAAFSALMSAGSGLLAAI